jgi:prepilin-type N-terminal cleavage/methylation domain-containing protein
MKKIFLGDKKGFSLIEIVITMTIVAILGGIATVAILKERTAFHQTACMSNLRQISQGMQIYYNENGKFPKDGYPDDGNDPLPLSTELANYVPEKRVFICPEDNDPVTTANSASYDPYYVARKDPYDVDKLLIGCPHHRDAKKATNLLGAGATTITNIDTVLVNGQEIPPDGTSAERNINNVNDEMTFSDGSSVKILNSQAGYGTYLVQSVRLADGTLYSIIRVEDEGTIDVQVTSGSKFEVVTPSAILGVRGTRFTVETVNANNTTIVTIITGTVVVLDRTTGKEIELSIGGTTTVTIDDLDDGVDNDGDGYTGTQGDCDDGNPIVHPGAGEILDNGIDDDCNPVTVDSSLDIDNDGDGFTENMGDCDDANPSVNPGMAEIPGNGIDDDCNPATADF